MIGRVTGTLVDRSLETVVVDVAGVGYELFMTARDLAELPHVGEDVVVHTHLHVREDVMTLYGFAERSGRDLFRVLLGASGVGPKLALAMLATLGPDELRTAVLGDDVKALTAVPGVGTRTAQKLVLELRARFDMPEGDLPGDGSETSSSTAIVRQALEDQGFTDAEIRSALAAVDPALSEAEMLREAYKSLGTRS
jgi:Holliday junction DNA helicase RuvA